MKIGKKISLGYGLVILLVGLLSCFGIYLSQRALKKTIGRTTVLLAQEMTNKIDRNIYRRIEGLQQFLNDTTVRETVIFANDEYDKLRDINQYIKEKDEQWIAAPAQTVTPFMAQLINNRLAQRLKDMVALYDSKEGYKVFPEIFITNKYGANIAQNQKTSDYYQADEEWWQKARLDGLYVGDVSLDDSSNAYSIDIGIGIYDRGGNFIGAAKVILNIEEIINIMKERKYNQAAPKSMEFKLVDRNGRIIYTTEPLQEFANLSPAIARHLFTGRVGSSGYFIEQCEVPERGKELFVYARSNGYRDYKGSGWVLLIEHETEEIFSPVTRLRNLLVILLVGGTIINIIIGLFVSRAVSRPAEKLARIANEIGKGKLDTYVKVDSRDEFALLAESFNEMVENLKKSTTSIENLNKEISERKKAEEYLRNTYEELKRIQGQLIQAEKLNAVGLLASGVAHEVKNPLAVIIQGVNYLLKKIKQDDTDVFETLNIIKRNVKRADDIIKGLLDFSKPTSLSLHPVDVNSILEKSFELLKPELKADKIKIVKETKKDLPKIMADKNKIEQVFVNILLNAVQAMPEGGVIFLRSYDKKFEPTENLSTAENKFFTPGERVVIVEIEDTGIGIAEADMKNIFDPFFTTKGPRAGAGLGLPVSRSIINMHKGAIEVESLIHKGTKVIITLKINAEVDNG